MSKWDSTQMEHYAQETCKSVGPMGACLFCLLFVTPAAGRSGDHLNMNAGQRSGGKARERPFIYLVGRWVSSMLCHRWLYMIVACAFYEWSWRLGSAAHQLLFTQDRRTLLTALAMSKQYIALEYVTGSNSCLFTIIIYHDEFILNKLVSFSIRTAISLDRHGYLQIIQ